MLGKRGDTLSPTPPSAQEVNELYERTQIAAADFDFGNEHLNGAGPIAISNLVEAYDAFVKGVNARREIRGKPPYDNVDEVFWATYSNRPRRT